MKRHPALQPLSREHHHGLLLCPKKRKGYKRNTPSGRIKEISDLLYVNYLLLRFETQYMYL